MNFLKGLSDLFFPEICVNCNRTLVNGEKIICTFCEAILPINKLSINNDNKIIKSLWGRVNIDFAYAYLNFRKEGITQNILHFLKYKNRKDIGLHFGKLLALSIKDEEFIKNTDFLIPVPLHKSKQKKRGYNQSYEICKGINEVLKIPVLGDNIIRISKTLSQTNKHRFERWENVSKNFEVKNKGIFVEKNILIVDDVFTTGATIEACCQPLQKIDNLKIGIATLAIAY
ncbi:MAG: ComF family protein [Bacteroidia bacterium]|nr:ComF family protein [Bacteroidia bacterium]